MAGLLSNGRFRALIGALILVLVAHFGVDGVLQQVLTLLATALGGAAIPSETFGAKN